MKSYRHAIATVIETPWLILPSKLEQIMEVVRLRADGKAFTDEELAGRLGNERQELEARRKEYGMVWSMTPAMASSGGGGGHSSGPAVAVMPLYGTLMPRADMFTLMSGGTSLEMFGQVFDAMIEDDRIDAVVIDVDSPGGMATGLPELAAKIQAGRDVKPVIAVVDFMAASAAYYLASQASELVITPSGRAGSIGAYVVHTDMSAALAQEGIKKTYIFAGDKKIDGNPTEPLSDRALADVQAYVDSTYQDFVSHVAAGRKVSVETVLADYGQGALLSAQESLDAGMVDRIATLDETVADLFGRLQSDNTSGGRVARALTGMAFDDWQAPAQLAAGDDPEDDTVECQACRRFNDGDAVYCDQCGARLDNPSGQPYMREPDENVQCPTCMLWNEDDAIYCDQCGGLLPELNESNSSFSVTGATGSQHAHASAIPGTLQFTRTATLSDTNTHVALDVSLGARQWLLPDRRGVVNDETPEKEITVEEPQPASAATPRQDEPAREDLTSAVVGLRAAVEEMNAGRVDRETVERQAQEVVELRQRLDDMQPRTGFVPDDVTDERIGVGYDRLVAIHQMPSAQASTRIKRPQEDVAAFQEASDNLVLLAAATKRRPEELAYYQDEYLPARQAVDSQTTAEGKEFVPTILSGDLIQRVELALRIAPLFRTIDMPSNPFEIPGMSVTRVRGGKHAEQTADTGQTGFSKRTPGTRKVAMTAVKFAAEVLVSKEEEEDSLIPILPFLRDEVVFGLSADVDDTLFNGDTTGSHQDSDVSAADDPRKNWMGLRKLSQTGQRTDGGNAALTAAMLRTNRKKMGKYGVDSQMISHIISIASYVNILADPSVITLEKYGPAATILTGELAKVDGIPLIVSAYVRDDMNASGVYDGTTTNRGFAATVYRSGWLVGNRRGLTVQLLRELYAEYDQDAIAVSLRKAFVPLYPNATEAIVAATYNLAT